jgi:hypothetical protein
LKSHSGFGGFGLLNEVDPLMVAGDALLIKISK